MGYCWNPLTDSLLASLFAFFQYLRFFMHFGTYIIKKSAASKIIVIDRLQVVTFYVLIYFLIKGVIVLISIYSIMECNVITRIWFSYTWYTKLCFLMSIFFYLIYADSSRLSWKSNRCFIGLEIRVPFKAEV